MKFQTFGWLYTLYIGQPVTYPDEILSYYFPKLGFLYFRLILYITLYHSISISRTYFSIMLKVNAIGSELALEPIYPILINLLTLYVIF